MDLPFVDDHQTTIAAPREVVWAAVRRYADRSLRLRVGHPLARLLGTDPPAGFAVSREVPPRLLALTGRHRFSRYRLEFELSDGSAGHTVVHARTYAEFPRGRGRVYRVLVIGSRSHLVAVRGMLRAIRRASTN